MKEQEFQDELADRIYKVVSEASDNNAPEDVIIALAIASNILLDEAHQAQVVEKVLNDAATILKDNLGIDLLSFEA